MVCAAAAALFELGCFRNAGLRKICEVTLLGESNCTDLLYTKVSSFFYGHRILLSSVGFSLPPFCPPLGSSSYRHRRSTATLQPHIFAAGDSFSVREVLSARSQRWRFHLRRRVFCPYRNSQSILSLSFGWVDVDTGGEGLEQDLISKIFTSFSFPGPSINIYQHFCSPTSETSININTYHGLLPN